MEESDIRGELGRMMRSYWYWDIPTVNAHKCAQCGKVFYPKAGRPDILCIHPIKGTVAIECKSFRETGRLALGDLNVAQRTWLDMWQLEGEGYIGIGTVGTKVNDKETPRRAWLIPWPRWIKMETAIDRKSVTPAILGEHVASFELRWQNGNWTIPFPCAIVADGRGFKNPDDYTHLREFVRDKWTKWFELKLGQEKADE